MRLQILCRSMLLIFLFCLLACGHDKKNDKKKDTSPKDYKVLTLEPRSITTFNDYPATIQGEEIVEIRPMVDGYLEAIYVKEGAEVTKGELLFKIKNPAYEQQVVTAAASIKIAEADVDAAKMNVEKVRPLVEKDIVSKYQLESAQFDLQSKEAALAQAKAALTNAKTNVGYTYIKSPQDGVIGDIPYKIGALVSSTTANPLTILSNIGNVFAYFSLNEKQLLSFSENVKGATTQDKLDNLPQVSLILADGNEYYSKGKLETASGLINTTTGTASFKAAFSNPGGKIRSGASATVRIPRTTANALLVPLNASYELQGKRFVYQVKNNNMIFSTSVDGTATNDGKLFIVKVGLKKGDKVVLNGTDLKDSTVIIPKNADTSAVYGHLKTQS